MESNFRDITENMRRHLDDAFHGTLDQLVAWNVTELRREVNNLTQSDLAVILTSITGRKHDHYWVSDRERADPPFTVSDLFLLSAIFKVSVLRFFTPPGQDGEFGTIHIDGIDARTDWFQLDYFTNPQNSLRWRTSLGIPPIQQRVGHHLHPPEPDLPAEQDLKKWAESLRTNQEDWLTNRSEVVTRMRQEALDAHQPHPSSGQRYQRWKARRDKAMQDINELKKHLEEITGGNDQQD